MATRDWLLGCIPLQETDTGLFNRAYYLSGSYGLWKPVLTVGLGAVGGLSLLLCGKGTEFPHCWHMQPASFLQQAVWWL